jgi:hypothetical protein
VTVAVVARDLMIATRIADAGARAGVEVRRFDDPSELSPPADLGLVLVDWGARGPHWADQLSAWRSREAASANPRLILFGPHTDLAAHADARVAGLGPMWARSKLLAELPVLLGSAASETDR